MVGALVGGLQCQFLGRKKSLIIDNIVVFIGLVGLSFSYSFPALLLFRFILGFSVASLFVNVPSYTGEICQPKVRSLTGSFIMFSNSGGMCTMMVLIIGASRHSSPPPPPTPSPPLHSPSRRSPTFSSQDPSL